MNTLRDKRIGAVVVTDQNGTLQGILSERDIVRRMADTPGQTLPQSVEDLMTRDVKTCAPEDLLNDVLKTMTEGRFPPHASPERRQFARRDHDRGCRAFPSEGTGIRGASDEADDRRLELCGQNSLDLTSAAVSLMLRILRKVES